MKRLLAATAAAALLAGAAGAEDIKLGVILGFTGPLESITPMMAQGAELAMKEVTDSGKLLDGSTVTAVRADSTCIDAAAAQAAAERLVTTDKVAAIVGADCSGVTGAVLANVSVPNGIVQISPSATSPGLTTAEDGGLFFRTAPSDARQGEVIAQVLKDRGIGSVAISFTNNDYGKGLAESIKAAVEAGGGTVTIVAAHEDGKADYSAEVGALASAGGDALIVAGYVDQGGSGIIQGSLDSGAFSTFILPDGMYGVVLEEKFGASLNGSFGTVPGNDSPGGATFLDMAKAAGFEGTSSYAPESYDAAALIMLSMQAAGSSASSALKDKVMEVANEPGEKIYPGELAKGLELLAAGTDIDYVGATAVELIGPGEAAGSYREYEFKDGKITTVGYR